MSQHSSKKRKRPTATHVSQTLKKEDPPSKRRKLNSEAVKVDEIGKGNLIGTDQTKDEQPNEGSKVKNRFEFLE